MAIFLATWKTTKRGSVASPSSFYISDISFILPALLQTLHLLKCQVSELNANFREQKKALEQWFVKFRWNTLHIMHMFQQIYPLFKWSLQIGYLLIEAPQFQEDEPQGVCF